MNRKWMQKICFVLVFLLVTAAGPSGAAVITVNDREGGNFSSIQEAVDNARNGDTIQVDPGIYRENVVVYRELEILASPASADNGWNRTYVIGNVPEKDVFFVNASNVTIDGFYITGGLSRSEMYEVGIFLEGAENCTLENNSLVLNDAGIGLNNSMGNYIGNNLISLGYGGIALRNSEENILVNNLVVTNVQGIALQDSENNTLKNNTADSNELGVFLLSSKGNLLADNVVSKNEYGAVGISAEDNTLLNNTFALNGLGIYLNESENNTIYANSFLNFFNALDEGFNVWNNSIGNFWNDYQGQDSDGDGIGDTPYIINESTGSIDYKPFVPPASVGGSGNMSNNSGIENSLVNKIERKSKDNRVSVESFDHLKFKNVHLIFEDNKLL